MALIYILKIFTPDRLRFKKVHSPAEKHTALENVAWKDVHILYNEENLPTATLLYKLQLKC